MDAFLRYFYAGFTAILIRESTLGGLFERVLQKQ